MTVISDVMAFWGPHFRDVLVRVVVQQLARQPGSDDSHNDSVSSNQGWPILQYHECLTCILTTLSLKAGMNLRI